MKTLLDNTGVHSATKIFFNNNNYREIDLQGFLQLCITIIFTDELVVNISNESPQVNDITYRTLQKFSDFGFDKTLFSHTNFTENDYDRIYKKGADELSDEIHFIFSPNNNKIEGLFPEGLTNNYLEMGTRFAEFSVKHYNSQYFYDDIISKWKSDKVVELTDYLISISPLLRTSIKDFVVAHPNISKEQLYQLNIFMRYRINEFFASEKKATHTPSVARAKMIRNSQLNLINTVEDKLNKLVKEIKGVDMIMPSIMDYLIINSKGNINKLVDLTLKLREKAKPLRALIDKTLKNHKLDDIESKHKLDKELDKLIEIVKFDLGINTPDISQVFEFTTSSFLLFDIKQDKFKEWYRYRTKKNKVAILTEVSKFAIYNEIKKNTNKLTEIFRK